MRYCPNCKDWNEFKSILIPNEIQTKKIDDNIIQIEFPKSEYSCNEIQCTKCKYIESLDIIAP